MIANLTTLLGLRKKKTLTQSLMAADKKKLFLYALMAAGSAYGIRRAAPLLASLILKR